MLGFVSEPSTPRGEVQVEEHGAEAVIPAKRNRKAPIPHDREAYETRPRVEDLFGRIKDFGRVVLRKRKTARSYAGFVSPAFALVTIQLCQ